MEPVIIRVSVFVLKDVRTNRENQRDCWETLNVQGIEQLHQQARKTCLDLSVSLSRSPHFLLIDGSCSQGTVLLISVTRVPVSCMCVCVCKSRREARPCPSITMNYYGQIC